MWRAFSLIEITITLAIFVIASYFISPVIFQLNDRIKLNAEIENLKSFVYQVQTKARFSHKNYTLTISQDLTNKKWCVIAIQKESEDKKQIICDCLNQNSCFLKSHYLVYQHTYPNIILKNKSLYPNAFINIDGLAGRLESKCLYLEIGQESETIQFDQWGRVYVAPKNKRSTCKNN